MKKPSLQLRFKRAFDVFRGRRSAMTQDQIMHGVRLLQHFSGRASNNYDAGKTGRQREDWGTSTQVPYYDLKSYQKTIRARSRELYKNDSTYRGAINAIVNHVVGRGLRPKPRVVDYSNQPNMIINAQLERAANRYMMTKDWDAGGRFQFVGEGQRLALKTQLISGDVLMNAVKATPSKHMPVAWQLVEVDRLDDGKDNFLRGFEISDNIKQTVHGINLDEFGAPISYNFRGVENPVAAKNVIHSYLIERPEQYVGEPLGTAILDSVFDKHDLDEDYIQKSRAVAKFLWWLSTLSDKWPNAGDEDSDGVISMDSMTQFRSETMPDIFKMPDNVSETIEPLMRMKKHDICSGMGISYITVLLDMANVNFAAASMVSIKEQLNFGVLREKFIESLCQPFWERFVLNLVVSGKLSGVTAERFAADPYHYTRCEWIVDPIQHADPLKAAKANIENIKAGRRTLTEDVAERTGKNIEEYIAELEKERSLLDKAGIELKDITAIDEPPDDTSNDSDAEETQEAIEEAIEDILQQKGI